MEYPNLYESHDAKPNQFGCITSALGDIYCARCGVDVQRNPRVQEIHFNWHQKLDDVLSHLIVKNPW